MQALIQYRHHSCLNGEYKHQIKMTEGAILIFPFLCVCVLCPLSPMQAPRSREGQARDLKVALRGTDPSIPLVFVSENHDLGNTPTPETAAQFCNTWGDDYFSFWLFFGVSACLDLRDVQEAWLEGQLQKASQGPGVTPKQAFNFRVKAVFSGHYQRNGGGSDRRPDRPSLPQPGAAQWAGHGRGPQETTAGL
uniref:Uncharacterized protein n=1 Tax=Salmo trutta TaxID=8032 RepID=A0A674CY77_SALTR